MMDCLGYLNLRAKATIYAKPVIAVASNDGFFLSKAYEEKGWLW